jgi:hypothetical protein
MLPGQTHSPWSILPVRPHVGANRPAAFRETLRFYLRNSPAQLSAFDFDQEHFQEKWNPVFRPKMRQTQKC